MDQTDRYAGKPSVQFPHVACTSAQLERTCYTISCISSYSIVSIQAATAWTAQRPCELPTASAASTTVVALPSLFLWPPAALVVTTSTCQGGPRLRPRGHPLVVVLQGPSPLVATPALVVILALVSPLWVNSLFL
jgi:hypothetical protein